MWKNGRPPHFFDRTRRSCWHGRSHAEERQRQKKRLLKNEKLAEEHHRGLIKLDPPNHDHRRYLGSKYPEDYPQWIPKHPRIPRHIRRDMRSASPERVPSSPKDRVIRDSPSPLPPPAPASDEPVDINEARESYLELLSRIEFHESQQALVQGQDLEHQKMQLVYLYDFRDRLAKFGLTDKLAPAGMVEAD
ncbi:MAG: hypothetical protein LQ352_004505 [Teloschistes flavicans]|nr:MAG: hypothetical protein LQ352_004505 [Teloschistes flavicans]